MARRDGIFPAKQVVSGDDAWAKRLSFYFSSVERDLQRCGLLVHIDREAFYRCRFVCHRRCCKPNTSHLSSLRLKGCEQPWKERFSQSRYSWRISLSYLGWRRDWPVFAGPINFFSFRQLASIPWRRWSWLVALRCSRHSTSYRRLRRSRSWRQRGFTRWSTTRFTDAIHIHLFEACMFPSIRIFLFNLQNLFVPIFIGWLQSGLFHHIVDFLTFSGRMRRICRKEFSFVSPQRVWKSYLLTRNSCCIRLAIHSHTTWGCHAAADSIIAWLVNRASSAHRRHASHLSD